MSFLNFLVNKGILREEDIPDVTSRAETAPGGLDEILERGGLQGEEILSLKGEYYNIAPRSLGGLHVPPEVLRYIAIDSVRHYEFVPLAVVDDTFEIGIVDPDRVQAQDALQFIAKKLGMEYRLFLITKSDFNAILAEYEALVKANDEAIARAKESKIIGFDEAALKEGGLTDEEIFKKKGDYYGVTPRSLAGHKVLPEILKYIPEDSARHYLIAPLGVFEGVLEVGIVDPDMEHAKEAIQFISNKVGMPYKLFLVKKEDLDSILEEYKNLSGEAERALSELNVSADKASIEEDHRDSTTSVDKLTHEETKGGETRIVEDAPVTKIVAVILKHAVEGNASDVHIEHTGEKIRVRFRVDGVMYISLILPANIHSAIVARIKILAQMKLDEKRKPQDGRFSARMDGKKVDFRVSTFPAYYGEKVVMRILDTGKGVISIDQMGMSAEHLKLVRDAIATPYGLILITGPTGSGKSTTLYAMLNELDREKRNVISLEDPVEYNIPGVNQSQVRAEIGYTFASGLRSILRQDPDIIMVGEIRDKETAGLAVQAALTGHLVFSTLHTNNSAGVIPRLIDMEVDPYLIAPTLILAIGQRLLRTMCPTSKSPIPLSESMQLMIQKQFSDLPEEIRRTIIVPKEVYKAVPSPVCPSGTKGRTPVFEFLRMDRELEHVVLTDHTEQAVYQAARAKGMLTMKDDALLKAFNGIIPFEEVNNIV